MVVDKENKLMTARVFPHMVLIEVSVSHGSLTLSYPGMPGVTVKIPEGSVKISQSYSVFRESVSGYDLGEEVGGWLSDVILGDPEGGARQGSWNILINNFQSELKSLQRFPIIS